MIAVADTREHRLQSGRSRILASNWLWRHGFSAAVRPTRENSEWVWAGGVGSGVVRPSDRARKCWERIEERWPSSDVELLGVSEKSCRKNLN
jgi:hypothetical protein